jgi:hypothetical protein
VNQEFESIQSDTILPNSATSSFEATFCGRGVGALLTIFGCIWTGQIANVLGKGCAAERCSARGQDFIYFLISFTVFKGGCPLGDNAADTLIDSGRTDIVGMLFDRGVILNARSLRKLLQRGQFEFLREAIDRGRCSTTTFATEAVAEALQVDLLDRAFQQGFQRSARICMIAVAAGNLAVLQCAVEHGCPLDWKACMSAAGGGHLSCLQYIVGRGTPVPLRALPAAVRGGHLPCLRYLNEQGGCELTTALVFSAISADSVLCVRYLHEHGCYLDSAVGARRAATVGSLSCFQYYHEQAGPQRVRTRAWDTVWEAARKSKSGSVREYAQQHG